MDAKKYLTQNVGVRRFSGRKIKCSNPWTLQEKYNGQIVKSVLINGFRSNSYKFIPTVARTKRRKVPNESEIYWTRALHLAFPTERISRRQARNWITHIQRHGTCQKMYTVLEIYLSILLNMVGFPTCIPHVAITKHNPNPTTRLVLHQRH
jgi:hypothetical protein